ncbi:pyridoxamine 5'-phosphate oxidase family protein [Gordonia shandongensis]|uniref:pyridoxamine 5'-phosphate oxidase family protein n=1 Tax=Gordonia shandongensis TaxID=376351 RepID=UPI00047E01AD|nr:pyridoxamine 5'-phosphate oxidase family protein [Gordonia shandongensis]
MSDAVERLTDDQCWELLEGSVFGRLALCVDGQPEIFPLNVYVADGRILLRTAEGTKLTQLGVNDRAVFETDAFTSHVGWSVVAKGRARVLTESVEIDAAAATPLHPWVPMGQSHYVEIEVDEVSGRRFAFGPDTAGAAV